MAEWNPLPSLNKARQSRFSNDSRKGSEKSKPEDTAWTGPVLILYNDYLFPNSSSEGSNCMAPLKNCRIQAQFGSLTTRVLQSSGSNVSCMSASFLEKSGAKVLYRRRNEYYLESCGSKVRATEAARVKFSIRNVEFNHLFYIPQEAAAGVLLGADFLLVARAKFDFCNRYSIEDDEDVPDIEDNDTDVIMNAGIMMTSVIATEEWLPQFQDLHHGERVLKLKPDQKQKFQDIYDDNFGMFVNRDDKHEQTKPYEHTIELRRGYKLVNKPNREELSREKQEILEELLQEQVSMGIIEECCQQGSWTSPVKLADKHRHKPQKWRYQINPIYCFLNYQIKQIRCPFPNQLECLRSVVSAKPSIFSRVNVQVPLREADRHLTGFNTGGKQYQYRILPEDLQTNTTALQDVIMAVADKLQHTICYIDDIVCFSPDVESHLEHLKELFQALKDAGLKLNKYRSAFMLCRIKFLDHIIQTNGLFPVSSKVLKIHHTKQPENIKEVEAFISEVGFYSHFIADYSTIMTPLFDLRKPGLSFEWTQECKEAFKTVKEGLSVKSVIADFS